MAYYSRACHRQVAVRRATADVYAACIDSKVCVKVGYGNWSPGQDGVDIGQRDWGLAHSGPNFAVWEVSNSWFVCVSISAACAVIITSYRIIAVVSMTANAIIPPQLQAIF
jgi:Alpha-amylase C-terminal beta-sheet domain